MAEKPTSLAGESPVFATMGSVTDDLTPAQKLKIVFDLFDAGVDLMRQNIRRSFPEATPEEVDRRLQEWLLTRPGAEHGDCEGRLREPEEPAA